MQAWGSWGPTLSPHAEQLAFLSDRNGSPQVFVSDLRMDGSVDRPQLITFSDDPVVSVNWSADGAWLACAVATDGGVRTQVWVVRPDGRDARRIAGSVDQHAELGPWTRSGHRVTVIIPDYAGDGRSHCFLADPTTGELHPLATGDLLGVLDLSVDEHLVILKDGQRGKQFCVVVDRVADLDHPLLPFPATGSTEVAIIRPAPPGDATPLVAYVCTDAGLPRRQLVAVPLGAEGWRGVSGVLAARDDAELEGLDADDAGRQLLLVWNVAGRSELELFDTVTGVGRSLPGMPGSRRLRGPAQPGRAAGDLERRGTAPAPGAVVPEHPHPAVDQGRRRAVHGRSHPRRTGADPLPRPTTVSSCPAGSTGCRVAASPARRCCRCTADRRRRNDRCSPRSTRRWRPPGSPCWRRTSVVRPASAGPSCTPTTCTVGVTRSRT